ncbi:MAG TPA: hypothetical protein VHE23_07540 [Candidatus Acidoferrales bacterium]|nr:hypothetical protein [Candidatus Acidoferrales bacterium]
MRILAEEGEMLGEKSEDAALPGTNRRDANGAKGRRYKGKCG